MNPGDKIVIVDWEEHYEVNEGGGSWKPGSKTQKRKGPLLYIRQPLLEMQGAQSPKYLLISQLAKSKTAEVLGVFTKLLELTACLPSDLRGSLVTRKGKPLTVAQISQFTRIKESQITNALQTLADERVQWISIEFQEINPQVKSSQVNTRQDKTRQTTTTCAEPGKPDSTPKADEILLTFSTIGTPMIWHLRNSKYQEWHKTYGDAINVSAGLNEALQWVIDNPTRRKTARGMTKFLGAWLQRSVNNGTGRPPLTQADWRRKKAKEKRMKKADDDQTARAREASTRGAGEISRAGDVAKDMQGGDG